MQTKTSTFGVSKRESHNSEIFYSSRLYKDGIPNLLNIHKVIRPNTTGRSVVRRPAESWSNRIFCHTSDDMHQIPDLSIALAFTSPPYNVGKDYDENFNLMEYLNLISRVASEVYRVLKPGGRYIVNVANLGRKPYIPMHAYFYAIHTHAGFLPAGEIIWQKSAGNNGNCAWGSWMSAKSPCLRDMHEYLLVFTKERYGRSDKGKSDIKRDEFMAATLSVWNIKPESAKKIGHPAPFPVDLATRVIKLYSYVGDVVLDPFVGSGTTCVAAKMSKRVYVGYDLKQAYCKLAEERLLKV